MKEKTKVIIIWTIAIVMFIPLAIAGVLESEHHEEKHECVNFVRYNEHYQITPLTWKYRKSFKCIECGKDWKK